MRTSFRTGKVYVRIEKTISTEKQSDVLTLVWKKKQNAYVVEDEKQGLKVENFGQCHTFIHFFHCRYRCNPQYKQK